MQIFRAKREAARQRAVDTTLDRFLARVNLHSLPLPESPVPNLLRSNEAPNDSQIELIRSTIAVATKAKSHLEGQRLAILNERSAHSSWLAAINHRISQAEKYVCQHESILSSARLLPYELVLEIFHHCVVPIRWSTAFDTLEHATPWYLGKICTSWRTAALATPALWTSFVSVSATSSQRRTAKQWKAMDQQLRRSGTSPLDISIRVDERISPQQLEVVDLLVQHSRRWGTLNFKGEAECLLALCGVKGQLPQLTTLRIWVHGYLPPEIGIINTFDEAPKLRFISLNGSGASKVVLPFRQITEYREGLVGRGNDILSTALDPSKLADAFGNLKTLYMVHLPRCEPLLFSKLKHLILTCRTAHASNIRQLVLPSIDSIRITTPDHILHEMIQLISKSRDARQDGRCPLKRLYYRVNTALEPEEGLFTQLLQMTPCPTSLDIPLPPICDVKEISIGRSSQTLTLLPQLKSCRFYITGSHVFRSDSLRSDLELLCPSEDATTAPNPASQLPLDRLSLCFNVAEYRQLLNGKLNGYQATGGYFDLLSLKNELFNRIPALCQERPATLWGQSEGHNTEAFETLRKIIKYEIREESAADIYAMLKKIVDWDLDALGALANNARNVLKHWNTVLEKSLHLRRWAFSGPNEMVFIPQSHQIRRSAKALDLAYGMPGSGLFVNIPEDPAFVFDFVDLDLV